MPCIRRTRRVRRGAVLVLSMIFIVVFSALAVALVSFAGASVEVASTQHKLNTALFAAQSGLECAKYLVKTVTLAETSANTVTDTEAQTVWSTLCTHVQNTMLDGLTPTLGSITGGNVLTISNMGFDEQDGSWTLSFYRYASDLRTIQIQSTGTDGEATRSVTMDMSITKANDVLSYAIASRGRMWLTGDTTINGDVFSSWDVASISPFNMTSDSTVLGTVNTVLTLDQIDSQSYDLETLNDDDKPMFTFGTTVYDAWGRVVSDTYGPADENGYLVDLEGNPVYDEDGYRLEVDYADRVYSSDDEVQAYHENINYDRNDDQMSGMDISDYDTSAYKSAIGSTYVSATGSTVSDGIISTSGISTVTEYFPHASGSYTTAASSSSRRLTRYKFQNKTFTDVTLPSNKNALFSNCTFEGVLFIDCGITTSSYNNVRFDNCTFNGVIVTNTPRAFKWQYNTLYFTGTAAFNNQSSVQEATILAPHFNINLGNTNPDQDDNNVLTGAIVGGIVDVRGNAQIYGTIISMADTTCYTSGYVTNIGATLDDGGSETTELGDIGVIAITPEEEMMLPSGITTPIVISPDLTSYSESI